MPFTPLLSSRRSEGKNKKAIARLSTVVEETAVPATVALLKDNEPFRFPSETTWALLILQVEDIGGLGKIHRNDEDKGQLAELIRSDHLHVVATADMLDAEVLGIIPDETSLSYLDEFSLMKNAPYFWGVAWEENGDLVIEQTDTKATYSTARDISVGETTLKDGVGEKLWATHSGTAGAETSESDQEHEGASESAKSAEPVVYDEDSPAFDQSDDDDDAPVYAVEPDDADDVVFEDDVDEDPAGETTQLMPVSEDEITSETEQDDAEDIEVDEDGVVIDGAAFEQGVGFESVQAEPVAQQVPVHGFADQGQVQQAIARRFMSGDLDLVLDLDEFNATFAVGAPVVQIATPVDSSEWLADQVAHLSRQANAALFQLHQAAEDQLRTTYVNLASTHMAAVEKLVSLDNADSPYVALKKQAEARHDEALGEKERKVRAARHEVIERHETAAKEAGEAARRSAETGYLDRHRSRMEREQTERVAEIERSIEADYISDLAKIDDLRRRGAQLKMAKGTTAIFEVLSDQQQHAAAEEQALLNQWSDQILQFIDDHRKADVARMQTLAEHDQRVDDLAAVQQDYETLVASIRAEHEHQIEVLQGNAAAAEAAAQERLRGSEADWRHQIALKDEQLESAAKDVNRLSTERDEIRENTIKQYEAQLEMVRADRDAAQRGNAHVTEMQKRSNSMLIVLIVVLGIMCFLAGGIAFSALFGN